ncbi:MAG: glycosyltransferase [Bacteroidales bacterium]|nr:glycosyltransferase [Bacteroidales bacterium]
MSKPSIIILMHYLELGGAEMALIGLLSALDPEKVDVDLFIYDHRGPLMRFIPEHINLLPEKRDYSVIERPLSEALKKGCFGTVMGRLLSKIAYKRCFRSHHSHEDDISYYDYLGRFVTPFLHKISPGKNYDLAISFLIPHQITRAKVNAKKYLAWIHTDYSTVQINPVAELKTWNSYDHIASISREVAKSFLTVFPSLKDKVVPIENILPVSYIKKRADEKDVSNEMPADLKLLSIGRFTNAKNFDNVPSIASELKKHGIINFQWYIIGFGADEELIRRKIAEANVKDKVIILGKKENPYPYIKACDIYIQPSRYEGKSITVREAQVLGKPVAITNYPTAKSQVINGKDGVIVPMANEECAAGIAKFILDSATQNNIKNYLQSHNFGNEEEVSKIYDLIK